MAGRPAAPAGCGRVGWGAKVGLESRWGDIDMAAVRRYFALFDREHLLETLLDER